MILTSSDLTSVPVTVAQHSSMSHVVPRRVGPHRVLCCQGDAAHGDDGQDAELKVLQSQDVMAALAKPATKHKRVC